MSDFRHIAEEIAGLLSDLIENGSSISSSSLAEIGVRASGKNTINMYPGVPGHQCHDLCVFISLS